LAERQKVPVKSQASWIFEWRFLAAIALLDSQWQIIGGCSQQGGQPLLKGL
jgi:hypothetical protein